MEPLYSITADLHELQAMLDDEAMGIDDVADTMEALEMDLADKIEGTAKLIKMLKHDSLACHAEGTRLMGRHKRIDKRIEWLQSYVTENMVKAGKPKLSFDTFTVTVRTAVRSLFITHLGSVPLDYMTTIPAVTKPDNAHIKQDLMNGIEVPGAELLDGKKWLDIR
jgi:hypothetical protein